MHTEYSELCSSFVFMPRMGYHAGKRLEEITAPSDGSIVTLRQYPIVYEKESLATILTAKKSWRGFFAWGK